MTVTKPGTYVLTVRNPVNGCVSSANVVVLNDTIAPSNIAISSSGTLSDTSPTITLSATSTTMGTLYRWIGPDSVISNESTLRVSKPGNYSVTATNPNNNCSATASVVVKQN